MPGMYDDMMAGPFEKFDEIKRKNGKIYRKRRQMTRAEIEAANADLLDQIAIYAAKLEYLLNKYGLTPEQLDKEMKELLHPTPPGGPAALPDPPANRGTPAAVSPEPPAAGHQDEV